MVKLNKNIVLIGMPGCGKSTIAKILAKNINVRRIDIDKSIERETGKSIAEIFEEGEEKFRKLEREAVQKYSRERGIIISTGGGVIKNYSNIEVLKQNGIIIFIDRPLENIAHNSSISKRPLLKDGMHKLYELYDERYELYKKCSDYRIVNDGTLYDAVEKVIKIINK